MSYTFNYFYELISFQAQHHKNKVALFIEEEKITYKEILHASDNLANFLSKQGVQKGDRVALFLRNSKEFVYAMFAVSKLGAILVPINTFLKSEELSYILKDSGASFLIASALHENVVNASEANVLCNAILWEGRVTKTSTNQFSYAEVENTSHSCKAEILNLKDIAVYIYTSGTTGKPKAAMLSYKNIFSNASSGQRTIEVTKRDRFIVFLPMFHSFTFTIGVMLPLYVGASLVIIPSVKPFSNIFKQVLTKRVTLFFGIPDVYTALAKANLPWYFMWFNRIRAFVSGAAPLHAKTLNAMSKKFKRATLLEGYGLSEASPAVCMNTFEKQKVGSVGTVLHGYELKIVDEQMQEVACGSVGDIIFKGDNVMQGYLNRPRETEETIINGWLLTGDVGYVDEEGFLFIVDRKKDLIISKGINIYPREVEDVIDSFEGVALSAVVGIKDENSGEIPVAYIELEEGTHVLDEVVLKKYMRKHLANYKIPKHLYRVDSLPKNATGKVLKRQLKERMTV
jgi:long-chain acyl-CoA synthetase